MLKAIIADIRGLLTRRLFQDSFFLVMNTLVMTLSGFIFWVVVARVNSPQDVGISSTIISAILLIGLLSMFGLNYSMIRFLPGSKDPVNLINSCVMLTLVACLILASIFLAGLKVWSPKILFLQENALAVTCFALVSLLWTLTSISEYIFIARQKSEYVLYKNLVYAALRICLPIVAALLIAGVYGIVGSWGLAIAVSLLAMIVFFLPKAQPDYRPRLSINANLIRELVPYAFGSYSISLFGAGPRLLLPLIVLNVAGASENAYFFIAWSLAELTFSIPVATSLSLFSLGSNAMDSFHKEIGKSLKITFLFIGPAAIVFILAGYWILMVFGQVYATHSLLLLQILALSSLPTAVNYIYAAVLRIKNRLGELNIIRGIIAIITLVASYFMVPIYGIVVIGFIWAGIQTILAVYSFISLHKFNNVRFPQQ
jgi:O-antigen/teichoic acid export membrane protein